MVLELDEEVLPAEDRLESTRQFQRLLVVVSQERLEHDAAETARRRDEAPLKRSRRSQSRRGL